MEQRLKAADTDIDRAMKTEQLRRELKFGSHSTKWYAGKAVQAGVSIPYVSMRYGVPVETLERWKAEWAKRAEDKPRDVGSDRVLLQARSAESPSAGASVLGEQTVATADQS